MFLLKLTYTKLMYKRADNIKPNSGYKDNRKCFIAECEMTARSISLCNKHYKQIKNYGHIFNEQELHNLRSLKAQTRKWKSHNWSDEAKKRHSERTKGKTFNTGRTHFKKGIKAWNVGTVGLMPTPWNKGKYTADPTNKVERMRFRKLRNLVFARDNDVCQMCFSTSNYLQVDHIKSWADYPDLRFELSNLRTLCMPCHYYITYKRKLSPDILWGHNKEKTT